MKKSIENLLDYLGVGKCAAAAAAKSVEMLEAAGFEKLLPGDTWQLEEKRRYYVPFGGNGVLAFVLPEKEEFANAGIRLVGAHLDHPQIRIKPDPEMADGSLVRLNSEIYGGPILYTWLDRPLGLCGAVAVEKGDGLGVEKVYFDSEKAVMTIPSLAIHMNPGVNDELKLNAQNDLLPVISSDKEFGLKAYIAEKLSLEAEKILDYELYVYNADAPDLIGAEEEFVSSPAVDDLVLAKAGLDAIIAGGDARGHISALLLTDHEEVGSETAAGARGAYPAYLLKKLLSAVGIPEDNIMGSLENSLALSADVAHAKHPAHPEKCDPTNVVRMGEGPVVKINADNKYAGKPAETAVFRLVCKKCGIPVQNFTMRADMRCGSTIGPAMAASVPMPVVDVGIGILAMHSAREMCSVRDFEYISRAFLGFYTI